MKERFERYKKLIRSELEDFFSEKYTGNNSVNEWGPDLAARLKDFVSTGKMIRGCFVLASYEMFKGRIDPEAIKVASAIELLHSALLIHDDVIDKDELRRGKKTIFSQYEDIGKKELFPESRHFGYSMAICAGDICIAHVFGILGNLNVEDDKKKRVISLFSDGLDWTGLAEMDDVYLGFTKKDPEEERIMNVYQYKTAKYTYSVPMMAGAILAGADDETINLIDELGGKIGIIFQIKDDELGIFGDEEEIGKPVGSDIAENKKTIFRLLLFGSASDKEKEELENIFGKKEIGKEEVNYVRGLIEEHKILDETSRRIDSLDAGAKRILHELRIDEESKNFFREFMDYNIHRKK